MKGGVFDLVNKTVVTFELSFYRNVKKNMFYINGVFNLIIVNIFIALIVENKNKISFFLCANFLLFFRHKQNKFPKGITPDLHQDFFLDLLVG